MMRSSAGVAIVAASLAVAAGNDANGPTSKDVPLFAISKSENKNQVQYAIRLDDRCVPAAGAPIWAYWKMLELGPNRTEPLLPRELPAYGLASQSVVERRADGGKAVVVLRAVPSRSIVVSSFRGASGACQVLSTVVISGEDAHLYDVYVKLKWPAGIDYLLLQGWSLDGSRVLTEKLE